MISFLLALQFLTIIPVRVKRYQPKNMARALVHFPIVGLLLGYFLITCAAGLEKLGLGQLSICMAVTAILAVATGGMHFDGLADTTDGLSGGKNRDEILFIMRDHNIGAMGALSIAVALILKIAFLYAMGSLMFAAALILMCVLSRWAMVGVMFAFPYVRADGKAKLFAQGINRKIFSISTLITLAIVIFAWQLRGLLAFVIAGFCAYLFGTFLKRKIGGITGDTLGAVCETMEIITLFSVLLIKGVSGG